MSSPTDALTPALQAYSVVGIGLLAGFQLSFTFISIPALLSGSPSPSTTAIQWKTLYDRAVTPVVTLAMTSSVGFATLAYRAATSTTSTLSASASASSSSSSASRLSSSVGVDAAARSAMKRNLYIAAALAAFSVAPYTRLVMWENIEQLQRLAGEASAGAGKTSPGGAGGGGGVAETAALVQKWSSMNFYRACMPLVSVVCGIWACVC